MKHWFSGNLYPLSIQIPTKRSGPPFKELTVFLDDTLSEKIIYLLNSWTDNYQDFWTKDYKKTKQKLDIKVKELEDKIDLLYLNAKENKYEEM